MTRYVNTRTSAVRDSDAPLGYPYVKEGEPEEEVRSYRDLQADAKAAGIAATGSREELEAALAAGQQDQDAQAEPAAEAR